MSHFCPAPKPGLSLGQEDEGHRAGWAEWGGWSSRWPLTFLSSLHGSVGLGCGLGRGRSGAGHQTGQPNPRRAPRSGRAPPPGSALGGGCCGGPGHPFFTRPACVCVPREQGLLGLGSQNKPPSGGARSRLGALPGGKGGAGGDERAFVSLCLCQDGNRLPPTEAAASSSSRCQGSPRWPGLCSTFLGWGALLWAFTSAPSLLSALVSQHTHSPTRRPASLSRG